MPPPSKAASGQGSHLINSQSAHFARRPLALRCRTPLSNLSLSSSGDISEPTYLDSTEYSKNYQPPPRKNTLPSTAHRSLPQRMHQSYLTLQSLPLLSTTTLSSSKFSFRRIMQGKLRQTRVCLSINHTCLEIPPARANPPPR